MDDQLQRAIEREIAGWTPSPVPDALTERLRKSLDEQTSWSDRVLAGVASCGGIAACVVVGIVAWQALAGPPALQVRREELAARRQVQAEMMTAIAMR